jgi:hypothetical protein
VGNSGLGSSDSGKSVGFNKRGGETELNFHLDVHLGKYTSLLKTLS